MRYLKVSRNVDDPSQLDFKVVGHSDGKHEGFTPWALDPGTYVLLTREEALERFGGFDPAAVE